MLGPSPVDAPNDVALTAERSDRQRSETRGARQAEKRSDHLETDSAGLDEPDVQVSTRRRPNRLGAVVAGVVSNVLGEVGDQIGSLGQVLPRGGVLIDRLWDAGSQTSPSGRLLGPRCGNPSSALFLYWAVTETSPDSPNFKVPHRRNLSHIWGATPSS